VVGRVAAIGFDNDRFVARVEMKIEKRYQFPKDTTASVLTSGLLGEQYVGLDAGGDSVNLAGGEAIKLTQSAVVLEKLISQFLYSKAAEGDTAKK
jgi:phospholipid/cholesterol/gamma-HCH transport system substrate-binding protein